MDKDNKASQQSTTTQTSGAHVQGQTSAAQPGQTFAPAAAGGAVSPNAVTSAVPAGQTPAGMPGVQQETADGSMKLGDRVTIEATVKSIHGDNVTLAIDRAPATDGVAPASTEGATVTLSTKQVRKS